MPPANPVTDARHTTTTFAYNQMNDQIATVDPNGIASVTDFDAHGQARQVSSGIHASQPTLLFDDSLFYGGSVVTKPWVFEFVTAQTVAANQPSTGTSSTTYNGYGSLNQTQTDSVSMSHLYPDVYGLRPGTPVRANSWGQTAATNGATSIGGAQLWVEDGLVATSNVDAAVQRRSTLTVAPAAGQPLSLPFHVDRTGRLRIHPGPLAFNGSATWAYLARG